MAVSPVATLNLKDDLLRAFLESFPTPLHHRQPESYCNPWVFWSQEEEEGCCDEINNSSSSSSSSSSGHHHSPMPNYHNIIISAFSDLAYFYGSRYIAQFWAPVTIGGRLVLSTSAQPFAISHLEDNDLKWYRLRSMEYQYNIDHVNNNKQQVYIQQQQQQIEETEEEDNPIPIPTILISGGPAAAFLNRMPVLTRLKNSQGRMNPLARYALEDCGLQYSFMLPICYPSHTSSSSSSSPCIGVLECTFWGYGRSLLGGIISHLKASVENEGLSICSAQDRIPYETTNALKTVRDEIEAAVKKVCESHNILLAQVWIPYADKNHVSFSSSLEDTRMQHMSALKLTGYVNKGISAFANALDYSHMCDMVCLKAGEGLVEKTLLDYKPRFCRNISHQNPRTLLSFTTSMIIRLKIRYLTICLRSIDTGDLDYAFEFMWHHTLNYVTLLKALLLTLKDCLPHFKFASGAELDHELELHLIDDHPYSEIRRFKIFRGKKSSPISSEANWKTAPKILLQEDIEQQFGNTMTEAANNLNVSLSTLKRKCKGFGIYEWQGRPNVVKRKGNASSSNNQSNIRNIEEGNGAIQEPSVVNRNENTLTIKAEYAGDMIKFDLLASEASFVTVQEEIGKKLNLTPGTYKLKYLDKDEDLILLTSDQDMIDCIKYFVNLGQHVVRLRVLPSP